MSNQRKRRKIRPGYRYSKTVDSGNNTANHISSNSIAQIITDLKRKDIAKNPSKPELGPRMRIKEFMNKYGVNVSDDNIITYMSEVMPSLGEDYVKGLINKVRNEIKKEIEAKAGEKGDDR